MSCDAADKPARPEPTTIAGVVPSNADGVDSADIVILRAEVDSPVARRSGLKERRKAICCGWWYDLTTDITPHVQVV